eukprot:GGOE01002230.1.p1 GENE.GGOE01002230.1~~GGOE01002230.1.p1  ORF type:complete len:310 (-),score=82.99 GGOE01002230.1:458-1387(-)
MEVRTLLWPPDAVTHVAQTLPVQQPWLEVREVTLLCNCTCARCARKTSTADCEPYRNMCVVNIKGHYWQLVPTTIVGHCPNSGRQMVLGDVSAMGFYSTFALVATLNLNSQWQFHAWDLTGEDALFFNPTKVEVFMMVLLSVGDTQERCTDRMEGLFKHCKQTGFKRSEVHYQKPHNEFLPLEDVVKLIKPMKQWCKEKAPQLGIEGTAPAAVNQKSPGEQLASDTPTSNQKRGRRQAEKPTSAAKRQRKEASPKQRATTPPPEGGESEEEEEDSESSLPAGWARAFDHEGTEYFFHVTTLETQWERPE